MNTLTKILLTTFCFFASVSANDNIIRGKVTEIETKEPIENCMVFLFNVDKNYTEMRLTDEKGNYLFNKITDKFYQITAKHMSYDGAEFGPFKYSDKFKIIDFELTPIPFQTETVFVEAEKIDKVLASVGFLDRKAEGRGEFLDAKEIKERDLDSWNKIINQFPFLKVNKIGRIATKRISTSLLRGNDRMLIYVDGSLTEEVINPMQPNMNFSSQMNALIDTESIAGIEYYPRPNAAPLQYQKLDATNGILLIWTK